jgi:hypothetical protein
LGLLWRADHSSGLLVSSRKLTRRGAPDKRDS